MSLSCRTSEWLHFNPIILAKEGSLQASIAIEYDAFPGMFRCNVISYLCLTKYVEDYNNNNIIFEVYHQRCLH